MVNFKDFHKAYTSAYNPSLFSVLDKKTANPRKPEEVEKLLKFGRRACVSFLKIPPHSKETAGVTKTKSAQMAVIKNLFFT